jgi:hypothetical protein
MSFRAGIRIAFAYAGRELNEEHPMKMRRATWLAAASLMAGLGMATNAHAVWTFDNANVSNIGNYANCSLSTTANCDTAAESGAKINNTTVSLSGFYVANSTVTGPVDGAAKWASSSLTYFAGNGQGMYSGGDASSPYHALDNNQNTEAILLSFSASTVLNSIGLGYTATTPGATAEYGCVSNGVVVGTALGTAACSSGTKTSSPTVDISLFRWTGNAAPTLAGTASTLGGSWELVGNYGDVVKDTTNPYNLVNSAGKTSSWWLISAYNSGFVQSAGAENRGTLGNGNDYFKLYSVAGTVSPPTGKVSEPATLALTGAALVGVAGLRRRKAKTAA